MALVKLVRDEPEVPGGALTMETPEVNVRDCLSNGWKLAENKTEKKETKVEEPKVESKAEVKVEEPKKAETPKKTKKTL